MKKSDKKNDSSVLTVKILEPEDMPLDKDFLVNLIECLGDYKVIAFNRKSKEKEDEGCACQRSW